MFQRYRTPLLGLEVEAGGVIDNKEVRTYIDGGLEV